MENKFNKFTTEEKKEVIKTGTRIVLNLYALYTILETKGLLAGMKESLKKAVGNINEVSEEIEIIEKGTKSIENSMVNVVKRV